MNNNKPHLLSAGYIDDTETYDSPYLIPADTGEQPKKVLCGYCKMPIHIDDWGGVQKDTGFFHADCHIEAAHGEL